jgi:hypothetical protein
VQSLGGALALSALLVVATPAAADYIRFSDVRPDDDVAVAGGVVAVGATPAGGSSTLSLYGLDGSVRAVALPERVRRAAVGGSAIAAGA